MVGTSKILTVSYGTFSCTLEGFDDSFNTMKAIAEYFRDLAADDRYFGAEPPTPDAEMLARIAEREISRRVEARSGADGVVLRPALSQPTPEPESPDLPETQPQGDTSAAAISAAVSAVAATPTSTDAPKAAPSEDQTEAAQPDDAAEQPTQVDTEAAPAEPEAMPELPAERPDEETASHKEADDDTVVPDAASHDVMDQETEPTAAELPTQQDEDQQAEDVAAQAAPVAPAPLTEPPAHPDADSVAAKLQRIRAVVGQNTAAQAASDYTEDMGGDDLGAQDMPDVTDYTGSLRNEEEDLSEPATAPVETAPESMPTADEDEGDARPAIAEEADAAAAAPEAMAHEAQPEDAAEAVASEDTLDTAEEDTDDDMESGAEFVGEITEPDLATLDGADDLDEYLGDRGQADLSPEEEAELMEAVAEEPTTTEAITDEEEAAGARRGFETSPEEDEASLNRLLDETDAQMQEPEGNRRRAAIAHLKAAVAATQADGESAEPQDDVENAFRDDLEKVVRPRRAPKADHHSMRPRPAPLKLVAAQRVDVSEDEAPAKPVQPVRPRRVQARARAEGNAPDGFAEFAEQMGARDLPDLLEAAAAYTSFVEGAEEFSRPQIIRRVRQLEPDSFNREDGLRSFADLLREGRINKVRNGRFQVAEDTRFHPQRQAS